MWNHPIKRFASSTFVAGALLATAVASHAQVASPCKTACLQHYRLTTKMCAVDAKCAGNFIGCRSQCIDPMEGSMPGPDRASCLAGCRSTRKDCVKAVAKCKSNALNDPDTGLHACKNACDNQ